MWRKWILYTAILILSGCMTTEARWSTEDLHNFKTDCSDPHQQAMLESQRVSDNDYMVNGLLVSSLTGTILSVFDGTYEERRKIHQGYRANSQNLTEYFREKQCLQQKVWAESSQ